MLPLLAPREVLEEKLVAQCGEVQNLAMENDRLVASHAAGDAGATRFRPLRVWRAPLIRGHGRRFVTRGIGQGVVELCPDTGLGRTSRALVIPITKCL
jgi:hypothetical protein